LLLHPPISTHLSSPAPRNTSFGFEQVFFKALILYRCDINDEPAKGILSILLQRNHRRLEILHLPKDNIGRRTIDLSCNNIDDEGLAVIANALPGNTHLTILTLSMNSVSESALMSFSEPLCSASIIDAIRSSDHSLTAIQLPFAKIIDQIKESAKDKHNATFRFRRSFSNMCDVLFFVSCSVYSAILMCY
jgi:hypothetical protein